MAFTFAGQYTEVILGTSSAGFAVALPSLSVHVYTVGTTTHPPLYTSRTKGTTTANPVTSDANGNLTFYVDPGQYDIVFTPPGGSQKRVTVTVPADPAESSAAYKPSGKSGRRTQPNLSQAVSAAYSGHGWINSAAGGTVSLNSTANPSLGAQHVRLVTAGNGTTTSADKAGLSLDFTDRDPIIHVYCAGISHLSALRVYLGDSGFTNYYQFDIESAQARSVANRYLDDSSWMWVPVRWSEVAFTGGSPTRHLITNVRVSAIDDNTGNAVTVDFDMAGAKDQPLDSFPNGVVSIVWDDGFSDALTAAQYMNRYLMTGSALPIVNLVGTGGYMTLAQLHSLQDDYLWGIGAHAYTDTNHNAGFSTLDSATVEGEMTSNLLWLVQNGFGDADAFAYPKGMQNAATRSLAQRYFPGARGTVNYHQEVWPPAEPYRMRSLMLASGLDITQAQTAVDQTKTSGGHLIISGHKLGATADSLTWVTADFQTLIDYINTSGIPVRTLGEVLRTTTKKKIGQVRGYKSGVYYASPSAATGTGALGNGTARACPIQITKRTAFDRIGIEVTATAVSSNVRLGIYADDGTGYPGRLIVDAGTIDSHTATGYLELTIAQTLDPGDYWLVSVSQGGDPTLRTNASGQPGLGTPAPGTTTNPVAYTNATGFGGALPANFGGTPSGGGSGGRVFIRAV